MPAADQRNVIGMGLDRQQHLALVRRARRRPFEDDLAGRFLGLRRSKPQQGRAGQHRGEEIASLHGGILCGVVPAVNLMASGQPPWNSNSEKTAQCSLALGRDKL